MVKAPETPASPAEENQPEIVLPSEVASRFSAYVQHILRFSQFLTSSQSLPYIPFPSRYPAFYEALIYPVNQLPVSRGYWQMLLNKDSYSRAEVCELLNSTNQVTFKVPCVTCRADRQASFDYEGQRAQCVSCHAIYMV